MTWTSYFLVVHEQTPKALRAGLVYFLMCAAGAYVMHFGILLTHAEIGSFEFAALAARAAEIPAAGWRRHRSVLPLGFAVKMGLVPLQSWLPLAHPEAPSSISGPLSGILTKAGVFGMVKVLYLAIGASALGRFAFAGVDAGSLLMIARLPHADLRRDCARCSSPSLSACSPSRPSRRSARSPLSSASARRSRPTLRSCMSPTTR